MSSNTFPNIPYIIFSSNLSRHGPFDTSDDANNRVVSVQPGGNQSMAGKRGIVQELILKNLCPAAVASRRFARHGCITTAAQRLAAPSVAAVDPVIARPSRPSGTDWVVRGVLE